MAKQTGQHMEQLSLVPNLNLRRLIKDLLNEGGEGLYVHEMDGDGTREGEDGVGCNEEGHEYRFALVTEHILVLKVRKQELLGCPGIFLILIRIHTLSL